MATRTKSVMWIDVDFIEVLETKWSPVKSLKLHLDCAQIKDL